ncbi:S8 family serine peptidase [Parafilimonas sp.]|uniref:S8 family serine peptidase n=1 Tax=Parafilimonas sp. TaxID=1969739 RepID=UPI0039E2E5C0
MTKHLPIHFLIFPQIKRSGNACRHAVLSLIAVFLAIGLNAQNLKPKAMQEIKFLMQEKASRTPVQKKIESRLLVAYKMQNNTAVASQLPSLKSTVKTNSQGKVKVDMEAQVSPQLLSNLKALGADIIFSSERFSNIVANVPLNKVEEIAGSQAILHINQWQAPTHNDPRINGSSNKEHAAGNAGADNNRKDFAVRAANVRNKLNKMLGPNASYNSNAAGSVASEADATHKAALARAVFGATGAGVKIGVLSDGVDDYETSQATGDLPSVLNILPGQAGSGYEGRAMLELIHDIAPDAELYFATAFTSQASFAQNILDLRAAGCDIIVDDVTYYAEGVFQDDNVAQSVNAVTASGALYFSSAGNSGNVDDSTAGVWEGDFTDGGSLSLFPGTVNDFGGGALYNTVTGTTGLVTLKWSDPLGASSNDYDIYATTPDGSGIVDFSTNVQDGDDNPYEYLHYAFPATYRFYIIKNTGAAIRALHLNTNRGRLAIATPGVMYGHNAAGSAYTVAATPAAAPYYSNFPQGPYPDPFNSSNVVEGFSSDGPRRIFYHPDGTEITAGNVLFGTNGGTLLQKPDVTAADGCATSTPGFETFYGTSAAAPNAAAIAALVLSKFPDLTPAQIHTALVSSAIDIEASGTDRDAGAGIVMTYEALEAAGATAVYIQAASPVTITSENGVPPNNAPDPGETVTVTLPLVNTGNIASANLVATLQATGGVTNPGSAQTYGAIGAGDTIAKPFTFTATGNCGDSITLTLALDDNGVNAGTVTYALKLGTTGTQSDPVTFANTGAITIPLTGATSPYPSTIAVSGLTGKITKITVGLKQFNHTWPGDVDVLLVSPGGKKMVIMSDVMEYPNTTTDINLVLDDDAASLMPAGSGLVSGTYKPTNYGAGDVFDSPAPEGPYENPGTAGLATLNSAFGGEDPNGTWSLYVVDDYPGLDKGNFNGGWDLTITTAPDVCAEVPPSGPVISVADKSVKEGNGYKLMYFSVSLSEKPAKTVTATYTFKGITATPGVDYIAVPGILVFPANTITKLIIPVLITGDKVAEADETFKVVLHNPVNATLAKGEAIGTIINDDGAAKAAAASGEAATAVMPADAGDAIKLAPNPATGKTNLSLSGYSGKVTILVSDMKGKTLQERKVQVGAKSFLQSIDVSCYAAGTYLITVIDEKGKKEIRKLIVAR